MTSSSNNRPRILPLAAAFTLAALGSSQAAILVSENFNYPQGTFITDAWNGGSGWNGAWRDNSSNATYDPSIGADGRLHTESASAADRHKGVIRTFSNPLNVASSGTLWGTVSISVTSLGETGQYAWVSFMTGNTESFRYGRNENATTGLNWGVQAGSTVVGSTANSTVVLDTAATLVFKIEYVGGNTVHSLWVNPGTTEAGLGTPDATVTANGSQIIDSIRMQSRASATFDNFVIGTTFNDVIPEPSTALLGLLGSGLLFVRRRNEG